MTKEWCFSMSQGIRLMVQILPNAKRNEVIGLFNDTLKIRIQAQPIEGKANQVLIRYIADRLHVPQSAITITHGLAAKQKTLEIRSTHLTLDTVKSTLLPPEDTNH